METLFIHLNRSIWMAVFMTLVISTLPFTKGQCKDAESENLTIVCDGQQVSIRLTYPFTDKVDGVVLWINDGKRDSFIADVAQRYYDVRATLRGSLFKTRFASAEYTVPSGLAKADVAVNVIERLRQIDKLNGLKFTIFAFDAECHIAATVCSRMKGLVARAVLVSPLLDNSVSSLSNQRLYAATATQTINYNADTWDDATTDSLNKVSSLDTEYSGDVLSQLLFIRQHQEPLDCIAAWCDDVESAMTKAKRHLLAQWEREDKATHSFWHNNANDYCLYFLRHLTTDRIAFQQTDMKERYGNVSCPVMFIYGKSDATLDAEANAKMMVEALRGKDALKEKGCKQVLLDGYDHHLKQTLGPTAGSIAPETVVAIVSCATGRRLVLKTSHAKKAYERLKAFGLSIGGFE